MINLQIEKNWVRGLVTGYWYFVWSGHWVQQFDGQKVWAENDLYEYNGNRFFTPAKTVKSELAEWLDENVKPRNWRGETITTLNRPSILRPVMFNGLYFKRKRDVILFKLAWQGR